MKHTYMGIARYFSLIKRNWKEIWPDKTFRWQIAIIPFYFLGFALFFPWFFDFIEARDSKVLNDIVLQIIPSRDVSLLIFICLYPAMCISMVYLIAHPRLLLLALETYCMVTTLRIICITLFPLNPPDGYMPLQEPVAQLFANDRRIISKDLFFSGHVATVLSLYFPLRNKTLRHLVLCLAIMVGILVLVQHVHYTIDVIAAVAVTVVCYFISLKLTAKIKLQPVYPSKAIAEKDYAFVRDQS